MLSLRTVPGWDEKTTPALRAEAHGFSLHAGVTAIDAGKDIPYDKDFPYTGFIFPRMIVSKLTTKAQTTIPQPVRAALRLGPGDQLAYEIDDQRVILTKVTSSGNIDDPFRTFREWSSDADAKAYAKL